MGVDNFMGLATEVAGFSEFSVGFVTKDVKPVLLSLSIQDKTFGCDVYSEEQSMHELAITQSILKIALQHAEKANAKRVTDLNIVMGELSSMVDDSIQFYWEIIARDTIAGNAVLHFRRVPAQFQCTSCSERYHPIDGELACPRCSNVGAKIIAGEEFLLESIDVE